MNDEEHSKCEAYLLEQGEEYSEWHTTEKNLIWTDMEGKRTYVKLEKVL